MMDRGVAQLHQSRQRTGCSTWFAGMPGDCQVGEWIYTLLSLLNGKARHTRRMRCTDAIDLENVNVPPSRPSRRQRECGGRHRRNTGSRVLAERRCVLTRLAAIVPPIVSVVRRMTNQFLGCALLEHSTTLLCVVFVIYYSLQRVSMFAIAPYGIPVL